ncbi:DUF7564 family protein [Salinigranum marinum]|uniref:DUF7564 family protein n=1 Tax=Salinigranum marinum TaxID=1515595 RepID=UPI002989F08A|nr:hypothetical protein [Salinigranum marinum]
MVAHNNRRGRRQTVGDCVCIDCGTRYLFTSTYKGNYCPDCHETWIARQRGEPSPARNPARLRPSRHRVPDDPDAPDDPYDEE